MVVMAMMVVLVTTAGAGVSIIRALLRGRITGIVMARRTVSTVRVKDRCMGGINRSTTKRVVLITRSSARTTERI
jgi:hypothetical protein